MIDAATPAACTPVRPASPQARMAMANAVLDRRAMGLEQASIARDLGLSLDYVRELITKRRHRNDPRALSKEQARWERERHDALAAKQAAAAVSDVRIRAVELCRGHAQRWRHRDPDAASGCEHLADLWQHHGPRKYPNLPIPGSDVVLSTVHRPLTNSASGSSSALCAELV